MKKQERFFSPINIGSMDVKNRIVMSPMQADYSNDDGTILDRLKDYHRARAEGGWSQLGYPGGVYGIQC